MKKEILNQMEIKFKAYSINESFARACVAGFCLQLNPSIDELTDIKTAVSEAVTNSIVHAYPEGIVGDVVMQVKLYSGEVEIKIVDFGVGITDLEEAKQPFFTTRPNAERSGMGFTVMESFMDKVEVKNLVVGQGLEVVLRKKINQAEVKSIKAN